MIQKKNRIKKIIEDIVIYGIGNLGSRILTFLLIPLYTFYVQPADFGYYDLSMNLIFLLVPFLTLQMKEGVFRFLIDNENENTRQTIISYVYKILYISFWGGILIGILIQYLFSIKYFWWIFFTLYFFAYYEVQIQIVRGLKAIRLFVATGILTSFLIALFSYLFVVWLKWGITGIYMANILARMISMIIIEYALGIFKTYYSYKIKLLSLKSDLLAYTLPLLPSVLCWWVISYSAPFFIIHYLGLEMNGKYSIALKFSTVLVILSSIFHQAWQETSILEFDKPDRNSFFSKLFNYYLGLMVFVSITFAFILKLFYLDIVQSDYYESIQYVYILYIGVCFYALVFFIEFIYHCIKSPKLLLPGIIITAIFNLIINWIGIVWLGIWGTIFANLFTWIFLFILRFVKIQQYVKLRFSRHSIFYFAEIVFSGLAFYLLKNNTILIIYYICLFILNIYGFKNEIFQIIDSVKNKLKLLYNI